MMVIMDQLRYYNFAAYSNIPKPRTNRERLNPMNAYMDEEFRRRYRFAKTSFLLILNLVYNNLKPSNLRNNPVEPLHQLLIALRFYVMGSYQMTDGDLFGIHQSSVCRIVHKVSRALAQLRSQYVKFLTVAEQNIIKRGFYSMRQFPGVIGAVDGTHIKLLQQPSVGHSELYRNRKDYFSLNVQIMVDHDLLIRDIVTRWYGSTHDSRIFNTSKLYDKLERLPMGTWALGDSSYPASAFIITPFLYPTTPEERCFNRAQKATRATVE